MYLKSFTFMSKAPVGRLCAALLFAIALLFALSAAAKAQSGPPFLVGQYIQTLKLVSGGAEAVEHGQWYNTLPPGWTDGLYVRLLVDGVQVNGQTFPVDVQSAPGVTITVDWTQPLTPGKHVVEFMGIEQESYYTIWDDKLTITE